MIYDCFSYWDEDLLLDLRLNILDNYVDYFVIVEGNKTWQNNPKKLRFEIDKFKKFIISKIDKILKKNISMCVSVCLHIYYPPNVNHVVKIVLTFCFLFTPIK